MLQRPRSKERASTGGPSYMDSDQVASYLQDLRLNRPQRPAGARPSPFSPRIPRDTTVTPSPERRPSEPVPLQNTQDVIQARSGSALSHTRSQSAAPTFLGRPLVRAPSRSVSPAPTTKAAIPSVTPDSHPVQYLPDGRRWMEKQEAVSLRRALEDMDSADDTRIHKAAQDEASELVWKHQNPDAPYRYRDHLRKGSYTRSHSQGVRSTSGGSHIGEPHARDFAPSRRTVSGSSTDSSADSKSKPASRDPDESNPIAEDGGLVKVGEKDDSLAETKPEEELEDPAKIKLAASIFNPVRKSSGGSARKSSGQSLKGIFSNPNDKIYEEPEETTLRKPVPSPAKPSPVPERRNPFARLRSTRSNISSPVRANTEPLPQIKKLDQIEIQKNPPSQSRNPDYLDNEPLFSFNATAKLPPPGESEEDLVRMKDGKEIRSDDIRAATSKRLSDRSANLPTPVLVSDKPGRPIISFKEQKEIVYREEVATSPFEKAASPPVQPPTLSILRTPPVPQPQPTFSRPLPVAAHQSQSPHTRHGKPKISMELKTKTLMPSNNLPDSPTVPEISVSAPSIPVIAVTDVRPPVPSIAVNGGPSPPIPVISVNDGPPVVPSISVSPARPLPVVSVSAPAIPTISVSGGAPPTPPPNRPLPTPTKRGTNSPSRPQPRPPAQHTKHMSLAGPPRTSILCSACALPIGGRIVSAAGSRFHPECFRCHHCSEALECVAFYPEPENAQSARIERIRRRLNNDHIRASETSSEQEDRELEEKDGWSEDMRFYCHLDFHEFFSPRCKSCKTPIEGEVIVACGAHWHAGHFFCAQCGDPFDASKPFVEKDGYAWCVNCHTNRFSAKCKKCKKPVIDTVVKALGAEWHEACFCCIECNGRFEDGRYFLRLGGNGQDPVCVRCEDRRLKA